MTDEVKKRIEQQAIKGAGIKPIPIIDNVYTEELPIWSRSYHEYKLAMEFGYKLAEKELAEKDKEIALLKMEILKDNP